jgi:hypothetical protein
MHAALSRRGGAIMRIERVSAVPDGASVAPMCI